MLNQTTLENGLIVNTYKKESNSVSISLAVRSGSFLEDLPNNLFPKGTAHFLEHMVFKGTKNRTQQEISNAIFEVGGHINAFTDFEETRYLVDLVKDEWALGLEILLDMVTAALIPAKDIDNERNIITQEINMYNDDSSTVLSEAIQKFLFPQDPNRHGIIGTEETISHINHDCLVSFYNTVYTLDNMILTIVGNVDHEEVLAKIDSLTLESNETKAILTNSELQVPKYKQLDTAFNSYIFDDKEQSTYIFGFKGPDVKDDKKTAAFEILSLILGGSENSRLFQLIREEHGLCYDISTDTEFFSDYSLLFGYAATGEETLLQMESLIESVIFELIKNGVSEEEVFRAKRFLKGRTLMQLDSNGQINSFITESIQLGTNIDINQYIEGISAVEVSEVNDLIKELLTEENFFSGAVVPEEFKYILMEQDGFIENLHETEI